MRVSAATDRRPLLTQLLDVPARPLHAGLQQRQRLKHLDKFTESDAGVLVATDVAARGLDIPDVRAVRSPSSAITRRFAACRLL